MSALQKLAGWLKSEEGLQGSLEQVEVARRRHEAAKPTGVNPAEHRAWLTRMRELDDEIESHRESVRIAGEHRTAAQAKADEESRDVEEREINKISDELAKLTIEVEGDFRRVAPKLERMRAHEERIAAWNAARGTRPFVIDGESRVRGKPARTEPAQFEIREVWEDEAGQSPYQFRHDASGNLVPSTGGYTKRRKKFQVSPERYVPASAPPRFVEVTVLPTLDGSRFWPR